MIPFLGCDEIEQEMPVSFDFRLLNEKGVPVHTFREGENFVFSFLIINDFSRTVIFQSMETEEFFKVYRLNNIEESAELSLGKPYKNIFCTYQNGYPIVPNDTLRIEIPWIPEPWEPGMPFYSSIFCGVMDNDPLPKGVYKTGFSSVFDFSIDGVEHTTPLNKFEILFNFK